MRGERIYFYEKRGLHPGARSYRFQKKITDEIERSRKAANEKIRKDEEQTLTPPSAVVFFFVPPNPDKPEPKGQNRKASLAKTQRPPRKSLRLGLK
jgi:hypothetical protein